MVQKKYCKVCDSYIANYRRHSATSKHTMKFDLLHNTMIKINNTKSIMTQTDISYFDNTLNNDINNKIANSNANVIRTPKQNIEPLCSTTENKYDKLIIEDKLNDYYKSVIGFYLLLPLDIDNFIKLKFYTSREFIRNENYETNNIYIFMESREIEFYSYKLKDCKYIQLPDDIIDYIKNDQILTNMINTNCRIWKRCKSYFFKILNIFFKGITTRNIQTMYVDKFPSRDIIINNCYK